MFPCTITCSLICSLKYSLGVKAVELLTQADCPTARGLCWDLLQIQWSSAYEIARADDAGGTRGRMSTIFGSYGQPKVWTIQRGEHGCFFHANQASCYMLLWRKHGYRTEENLESHGVHFAEAKEFTKSQRVYKVAGHLLQSPLLGCVSWSLDIGQLRIMLPQTLYKAALAGVLQQHYRSIDRISPDLPLAARRSNPFL